jgi:hypothetical protein
MKLVSGQRVEPYTSLTLRPKDRIRMMLIEQPTFRTLAHKSR